MNNQPPRVLYETVGKVAGINVLFDSQYSGRNQGGFNVDLNTTSVEGAFDYLALLTHTFWKPISANMIFVTEDNPTKRRDYEDNVLKIFYVTNTTTVQEFQEIAQAVRTIPEVRRTFTYNAQKAIIVRGAADAVAMAEKIIHDLDKPKSEVVVDVIVMEANSSHTRNLAASIVSGTTAGLNVPFQFSPRSGITTGTTSTGTTGGTTTGGTTAVSLANLGRISTGDFSTTLPNALLNLMLTDTSTKVRQQPQIRASDGQKAQLNIGDRIPYATGSFQPGVGTVGVSPLVQTQFNFVDTGVNVDITPFVHSAEELTLHIEINVSTVRDRIDIGGVSQPIIGQRKSTADIRLREGEVNILGGLSQWQDSKTVNGIPGLVNIPILGKLFFGSQNTDKERSNLMIALIPHIVRTPDYTAENLRPIGAGNDSSVKLSYNHGDQPPTTPEPPKPQAPKPEAAKPDAPAATVQQTSPQTPAPVPPPIANLQAPPGVVPGAAPPNASAGAPPAPPPPPPAGAPAAVAFLPSPVTMNVAGIFPVNIQLKNVNDLAAISTLKIKYDPNILKLNDLAAGEMISRDGRVTTVKEIHEDVGEATFTVTRMAGTPGVSGTGNIATLNFTAVRAGSAPVTVTELTLKNSQQQPIAATLGETMVTVR
jgi:general secretion pathway protein D